MRTFFSIFLLVAGSILLLFADGLSSLSRSDTDKKSFFKVIHSATLSKPAISKAVLTLTLISHVDFWSLKKILVSLLIWAVLWQFFRTSARYLHWARLAGTSPTKSSRSRYIQAILLVQAFMCNKSCDYLYINIEWRQKVATNTVKFDRPISSYMLNLL